jgi:hypothetical protein
MFYRKSASPNLPCFSQLTGEEIITSGTLPKEDRAIFITALLRLSRKSSLYPSCLSLKGVEREPFPCASGTFGDVYRGSFQGRSVCVKVVRIYKQHQVDRALKVCSSFGVLLSYDLLMTLTVGVFEGSSSVESD